MAKKYRLKQILLMAGMQPIILPVGYTVELKGDRYIGEGGWYFHPHGVEDNKYHWEEVVEKEFVWDDYLVIELLSSYAPFADNLYTIPKHIENFKELKSNSIKSGKGTANDVLNTEEKKKAIKSWIDFMPEGIDPRGVTANDVLNTEIKSGGHGGGSVYGAPLNTEREWEIVAVRDTEAKLERGSVSIHSVKRLSDSEVFSVGDRIDHNWKTKCVDDNTIKEITLENEMIHLNGNDWSSLLMYAKKLPTPSQPQNNKERIEISGFRNDKESYDGKWGNVLKIYYPYSFSYETRMKEKIPEIKTAIEKILNHE